MSDSAPYFDICRPCRGSGEMLHFYERPGGPPGNQMGHCPICRGFGWRLAPYVAATRVVVRWPLLGGARMERAA